MKEELLRMVKITKRFSNILANDSVNFTLHKGEVHGLLGENGAGKSTLMNILYGLYKPDEGEIYVEGRRVYINSPKDAIRLGIGRVPQFPELVESLTVAENLAMLLPGLKADSGLDYIREIAERYGISVDFNAVVHHLSLGEKHKVELIKGLVRGSKILILDEPTTMLSPREVDLLFNCISKIKEEGRGIIFVSHRIPEVLRIADRITILRRGKCVASIMKNEADEHELVRLMIGTDIDRYIVREKLKLGEEILRVEDLYVLDDMGGEAVKGVSFHVRRGEIFGIAGVAGNGQKELIEAITGLRNIRKGKVLIKGEEISSPRRFRLYGSHIPDERIGLGILPSLTILDNIALMFYKNFSNKGFIKIDELKSYAEDLIEKYNVIVPNIGAPAGKLSGGNIARLILARELSLDKDLVIAVHPTFGLDIASTNRIRKLILELRKKSAILLVSEDLEEILQLSDRIAVMYGGRFVDIMEASEADPERIGLMMSGVIES